MQKEKHVLHPQETFTLRRPTVNTLTISWEDFRSSGQLNGYYVPVYGTAATYVSTSNKINGRIRRYRNVSSDTLARLAPVQSLLIESSTCRNRGG